MICLFSILHQDVILQVMSMELAKQQWWSYSVQFLRRPTSLEHSWMLVQLMTKLKMRVAISLLRHFYRTKDDISLDKLRLLRFSRKAATNISSVDPKTLPPTSAAATHHTERIYHQVQGWLGWHLDPLSWGWLFKDNMYKPKMTVQTLAPRKLMESIYCGCKSGCTKRTCKCRKLGLPCTVVCLDCKGFCFNGEKVDNDDY